MKKIILFLVCAVCLAGCVKGSEVVNKPAEPESNNLSKNHNQMVVPQQVNLLLDSAVEKGERVPVLILSAVAGGGCDSVSDIQTKETYVKEKLVIDIIGYQFTKGEAEECVAVILESKAEIKVDIDWLKEAKTREIVLNLSGQENRYEIIYNQYKVTLSPVQASNVISHYATTNPPAEPIALETVFYPMDVGVLYLAGSLTDNDYRSELSDFAESKGLIPAEKVYEGLQQSDFRQLYVVVRNRDLPKLDYGEPLGSLPGEIGADVYLKRCK